MERGWQRERRRKQKEHDKVSTTKRLTAMELDLRDAQMDIRGKRKRKKIMVSFNEVEPGQIWI